MDFSIEPLLSVVWRKERIVAQVRRVFVVAFVSQSWAVDVFALLLSGYNSELVRNVLVELPFASVHFALSSLVLVGVLFAIHLLGLLLPVDSVEVVL